MGVPLYRALFQQLDTNQSQSITIDELSSLDPSNLPTPFKTVLRGFRFESIVELFEMLDVNDSGDISEDEFVDGLLNLSMNEFNAIDPEIFILLKLSKSMMRRTKEMKTQLLELRQDMRLWVDLRELAPAGLPGFSHNCSNV